MLFIFMCLMATMVIHPLNIYITHLYVFHKWDKSMEKNDSKFFWGSKMIASWKINGQKIKILQTGKPNWK